MADKPLFTLDAEGRWRLAYDRQQWVVQRRAGKPCPRGSDSAAMRRTGWRAVSFIGSNKRVLERVLGEKGVVLTAEAQARLDALPECFMDFIAAPDEIVPQEPAKGGRHRDLALEAPQEPSEAESRQCTPSPSTLTPGKVQGYGSPPDEIDMSATADGFKTEATAYAWRAGQ